MIYGTLTKAREYERKGEIKEWIQLFLRNDGKNIQLANGLLLEERRYTGVIEMDLAILSSVKTGAPEYLKEENAICYFFHIVDKMKSDFKKWDIPPLIVEYNNGIFKVNDGRHRLEMFRQLKIRYAYAVLWTTGDENYNRLLEKISCKTEK